MYQDNRREYGRVFGGVVFPGERPGFAVVLGEDRLPIIGNRHVYHQYLLGEFEAINHHDLLEACIELSSHFNVDYFFWRFSQTHENLLQLWNRQQRQMGKPEILIYQADFSMDDGNIEQIMAILRNRLRADNKLLDLTPQSKLNGYFGEFPTAAIATAKDFEYPAISALGYASATLESMPPVLEDGTRCFEFVDNFVDPVTGY